MADREVIHERRGGAWTTFLSWLAILLAIAALALAWVAYNRTGEDLENRIQQGINEAAEETDQRIDTQNEGNQNGSGASEDNPDRTDSTTEDNPDNTQ